MNIGAKIKRAVYVCMASVGLLAMGILPASADPRPGTPRYVEVCHYSVTPILGSHWICKMVLV